jgi:hypothetical protein
VLPGGKSAELHPKPNYIKKNVLTRITGILHQGKFKFFIITRSRFIRMKTVSAKLCIENQDTLFVF